MSQTPQKYVRKQYLVDKEMQTYHLKVWVTSSVVIIVTIASFFFFFKFRPETQRDAVITHNLQVILIATSVFIILYSIMMGLQALLHSHKVAGAEYNLKNSIRRFKNKDFSYRVTLRKGDYLQGLAEALNEMVTTFQEDREKIAGILEKLENLEGFPEEGRAMVEEIRTALGIPTEDEPSQDKPEGEEKKEEKPSEAEVKVESSKNDNKEEASDRTETSEEKKGDQEASS
ncbi:MAG: hypothetical protein D6785_12140 [Planctomycetota bacterium]|nr:MAG: hypothetical protein D6785_12140 [Planctomycetota bacterium]